MVAIREATEADWPVVWEMFRRVTAAGDSFAYDADTPEAVARKLWFDPPARAFVAEIDGRVVGSSYVRPNQPGRGDHVANAGYMVAEDARGKGIASALCEHSLGAARRLGFRAMQFNYVVSSNVAAVRVWEWHGFAVVGRLPGAFRHVNGTDIRNGHSPQLLGTSGVVISEDNKDVHRIYFDASDYGN